jgi:hypothetical protein
LKGPDLARLDITPVETRKDWRDFHRLPHAIYRGDPNWIAPILLERRFHFDPKHNPFFQHAEATFFLARQGGKPVGRITAQIDKLQLQHHNDATGHFGFLEAFDEAEVFADLLSTAEAWLRGKGMARVLGPVSFAMWDQPGLLVEGFDTPPSVLMGHARPYYAARIEAEGYAKAEDLIAYMFTTDLPAPPAMARVANRLAREKSVVLRPLRKDSKNVGREIRLILDILNDGWSGNWGFVPMTEAEIDDIAGLLKVLLKPGDGVVVEYKGEPVAFALTFPDVNWAARDLNGRLFPFGFAKLLWRLKRRHPPRWRLPLMGVRKWVQDSPLGGAMALAMIQRIREHHQNQSPTQCELSWVLERNTRIRHIIELTGAKPYKRYRIYEKRLQEQTGPIQPKGVQSMDGSGHARQNGYWVEAHSCGHDHRGRSYPEFGDFKLHQSHQRLSEILSR